MVWELPLYLLFLIHLKNIFSKKIHLNSMDKLVAFYFVLSCFSVFIGINNLIENLQSFRWTVIPPVIVYMVIRTQVFFNLRNKFYFKLMLPGLIIYALLFIQNSITNNFQRGFEDVFGSMRIISLSYAFSLAIIITTYLIKKQIVVRTILILLFSTALLLTFARAVIFGIIFTYIFVYFLAYYKKFNSKNISSYFFIGILFFFTAIFTFEGSQTQIDRRELREVQKTSARLLNADIFQEDFNDRIKMWKIFSKTENGFSFVFGRGLGATTIGYVPELYQYYASSHNFLISFFRRSGLLGILLLSMTLVTAFKYMLFSNKYKFGDSSYEKFLFQNMLIIVFLGLTNDLFSGNRIIYFFIGLGFISNSFVYQKSLMSNSLKQPLNYGKKS